MLEEDVGRNLAMIRNCMLQISLSTCLFNWLQYVHLVWGAVGYMVARPGRWKFIMN